MNTTLLTRRQLLTGLVAAAVAGAVTAGAAAAGSLPTPDDSPALPRAVAYAGLTWTIESAASSPADGESPARVRLGFDATSTLEDDVVLFPVDLLAIVSPTDGTLVRAAAFEDTESAASIEVEPGTSVSGTAVFELPDATAEVDPAALVLVIDEPDRTPAVLPLGGPLPPDPYPMTGTVEGTTGPIPGDCPTASTVEVTPLAASATLDDGADRAAVDTHFVSVDLRITGVDSDQTTACVGPTFVRLLVDGVAVAPLIPVSEVVDVGTSVETTATFEVSVDAGSLAVGIGADDEDVVTLPIALRPALPPPAVTPPASSPPG